MINVRTAGPLIYVVAPKVIVRTLRRRLPLLVDLRIDTRAGWYIRKFASLFAFLG